MGLMGGRVPLQWLFCANYILARRTGPVTQQYKKSWLAHPGPIKPITSYVIA